MIPRRPDSLVYQVHRLRSAFEQRRSGARTERLFHEVIASIDRQAFTETVRKYWTPFPTSGPAKFLDLGFWLREAARRYVVSGIDGRNKGARVLDLGTGTGYFLLVCRHEGHQPLGLDVDDEPLYCDCMRFFDLPRVVHRIEPMTALPELGEAFDLITGFMPCFDVRPDGTSWRIGEWTFFLRDLRSRLKRGGRVVFRFNVDRTTGDFYSSDVVEAFTRAREFRTRWFLNSAFLDAR
jgi:SAM-dependent methyltransferase